VHIADFLFPFILLVDYCRCNDASESYLVTGNLLRLQQYTKKVQNMIEVITDQSV